MTYQVCHDGRATLFSVRASAMMSAQPLATQRFVRVRQA
eukprot:COSAG01_NODE_6712_length_3532_cov_19.370146_2_plen_39_part_00